MLEPAPPARSRRAAHRPAPPGAGRLPAIAGLGAGGHAKCVVEALRSVLRFRVVALLEADPALAGTTVLGLPVLAGAIVGADASLGRDALVNAGTILGHDVRVGECAHLASGARVGGGVEVGPGAHVGTGAIVLQGRRVGAGALVGAGAVVTEDVPPGARVAGVPAAPLAQRRRVA